MFRKNYKDYNLYLNNKYFKLNLLDNEVPQGLCIIRNKVYVTCYKIDHSKSVIIEYNFDGTRNRVIELENRAHVGGIGYNKKYNLVFICDTKGRVSAYKNSTFEKIKSFEVSTPPGSYLMERGGLVSSYLTVENEKLYVSRFNRLKKGIIKIFDIKKIKDDYELEYNNEFIVPTKVQGLTFYDDYLILSKSYGKLFGSKLLIYKYDEEKNNYVKPNIKLILPPMLEQIIIHEDNNLVLLFESSSLKYRNGCRCIIPDIVSLDISKVIKDYKNK